MEGEFVSGVQSVRREIFVAIASYADPELPRTLEDCIANAEKPEHLRFGICAQEDASAPVPLDKFYCDKRFRFQRRQSMVGASSTAGNLASCGRTTLRLHTVRVQELHPRKLDVRRGTVRWAHLQRLLVSVASFLVALGTRQRFAKGPV